MAEVTLADLNAIIDRLDRNAKERSDAVRGELAQLREETHRIEKGVYHRIDELKRRLDMSDANVDEAQKAIGNLRFAMTERAAALAVPVGVVPGEPDATAVPGFSFPTMTRTQKVGTSALVLLMFLSALDVVKQGLEFARDIFKVWHP